MAAGLLGWPGVHAQPHVMAAITNAHVPVTHPSLHWVASFVMECQLRQKSAILMVVKVKLYDLKKYRIFENCV